ncbi:MAG: TIR domain-containing protein [Rhodocyclaceae bacterium]
MMEARVFLSFVHEDRSLADQCVGLLQGVGVPVCNAGQPETGEGIRDQLQELILQATHLLVLVGPRTRLSKFVDQEIELSTERRENGNPGAGVIGIILPSHPDYDRPYYEPENIPLRLHDLIESEYAILRKWTDNPDELRRWIDEADRRRGYRQPELSLRAAAQIYRFGWDSEVDEAPSAPRSQ